MVNCIFSHIPVSLLRTSCILWACNLSLAVGITPPVAAELCNIYVASTVLPAGTFFYVWWELQRWEFWFCVFHMLQQSKCTLCYLLAWKLNTSWNFLFCSGFIVALLQISWLWLSLKLCSLKAYCLLSVPTQLSPRNHPIIMRGNGGKLPTFLLSGVKYDWIE